MLIDKMFHKKSVWQYNHGRNNNNKSVDVMIQV